MSFTVGLSSDYVPVEAGATVPFNVEVSNRVDQGDRFELQIEGLDPEWTAIPVPSFAVDAHDIHTEKVFLKPPRVSESIAGTYPFVVKLRSLESGDVRSAQAVLEIKPFHHVSLEITPKRGLVSAMAQQVVFTVTVMNLGNSEHTFQLFASDPEDECAFEFEPDKVSLGPGQQKEVPLVAGGTRRPLLANSRLNSFTASARSIEMPSVAGSTQGQIEQRALVSPGTLIFFIALGLLVSTWLYFRPMPPTLDQFSVDKKVITVGESVMVSWAAKNATSVDIRFDGQPVQGVATPTGSTSITPTEPGEYTITGLAIRGDGKSDRKEHDLKVLQAPVFPQAKILEFSVEPRTVSLGNVINIHYKLNDFAVKATLSPPGIPLDIKASEKEVQTQRAGKIQYTLIAYNSAGKDVRQSISVTVTEGPTIVEFKADRTSVGLPGEVVRLSYQITDALKAEIDDGTVKHPLEPPSTGTWELSIDKTTTFTLIAVDAKGKSSTRKITIVLKPLEPPSTTDGNPGVTPTTAGGGP